MPVNSGISPARAFAYSPLGSRSSQTSSGQSTKTSMKSPGRVDRASDAVAVLAVRRDERREHDRAGVDEQLRDLADPADVLGPVLGREAEVAVEPVADVVAVEDVGEAAVGEQPVLDGVGERALAGAGEAGEPDDRAAVAPVRFALLAADESLRARRRCSTSSWSHPDVVVRNNATNGARSAAPRVDAGSSVRNRSPT